MNNSTNNLPPGVSARDVELAASSQVCAVCKRFLTRSYERRRGLCIWCDGDRRDELERDEP